MKCPNFKRKIFVVITSCLMICSVLFFLAQNSFANQNDEDISTTISGTLNTDSSEIYSSLMPCGTYIFPESPELDLCLSDHDSTRIDVSELQQTASNTTDNKYNCSTISPNLTGNFSKNQIPEYTISAPKDTIISNNIHYNFTNVDNSSRTINIYPNGDLTPLQWTPQPSGSHWSTIDDLSFYADNIINPTTYYLTDKFSMQNVSLTSNEQIKNITINILFKNYNTLDVTLSNIGTAYFTPDANVHWASYKWTDLYLDETTINGLELTIHGGSLSQVGGVYCTLDIQSHNQSTESTPFKAVQMNDFKYQVLGTNYSQTFNLTYNPSYGNYVPYKETNVFISYFFSSDLLVYYDHVSDLIILAQNISLTFYFWFSGATFTFSANISYSVNEWKVPTEVDLTINSESVVDNSYNSGFVLLSTYPTSLVIASMYDNVYFSLNISIDFSFTFNLNVISKTYLKQDFELESNHEIELEQINFDDNLEIKKIYLNNVLKGSSNPCVLSPSVSMNEGNVFYLEVILEEEIYIPLLVIYNHLGSGTANIYLSGISNALTFSNIDGNTLYSIPMPTDFNSEYANLTFSDIEYTPDYTSNYSEDESGYGYNSPSYGDEDVSYRGTYYQTNANGTKVEESPNSGYAKVYSEYFNALNGYMTHTYGDLDGQNSTYAVNDYLYMQNMFPSNFTYEDWLNFVLDYNSSYTTSSFTSQQLSSRLKNWQYLNVPPNSSIISQGALISYGNLWTINNNYASYRGIGMGSGSVNVFYDNFNDGSRDASWTDVPKTGTITEASNILTIDTNGVKDWWSGVANAPYCKVSLSKFTKTDYGFTVKMVSTSATNNKALLILFQSESNVWFYSLQNDGTSKINVAKIVSGTASDVNSISSTDPYLRILKIGTYYKFQHSADNITWTEQYSTNSLGITPTDCGLGAVCWTGTAVVRTFDNFIMFENRTDLNPVLNFITIVQKNSVQSNETVDYVKLYYSHKTNVSATINFYAYNFITSSYTLINSSNNYAGFYNMFTYLSSNYYNATGHIKLKYNATGTDRFALYIDKLLIETNWTKISGFIYTTITKDFTNQILNRYDIGFDDYQKLYNITIQFQYRYSNYSKYTEFAQFEYDGHIYTLTKDGQWHEAVLNFEFESSAIDSFNILFNITNGLLELQNFNYTIFFECLDTSNYNQLYQFFRYTPVFSLSYLQMIRGNFVLNFTYSFVASSDLEYYNFYNSINWSLLCILLYINTEDGWEAPIIYTYNTSQLNVNFSFNITNFILNLGKTDFNDFYIEFYLAGNPSNFTLDNLTLWDFDNDFYEVVAVWISDTLASSDQVLFAYWIAIDEYINRIEIEQTYALSTILIYNVTLLNNTLQSVNFTRNSAGFYQWNLTFYDDYDNYEIWQVNFTIVNVISISVGYQNPSFVYSQNKFSVKVYSTYSIVNVYYHNSTELVHQYSNSSYPLYEYEFSFNTLFTERTIYNVSILTITETNDIYWVNITLLTCIERTTSMEFLNFHSRYWQDDSLYVVMLLKDVYNNPLASKNIYYSITNPSDVAVVSVVTATNTSGMVDIQLDFDLTYEIGFYHVYSNYTGDMEYTGVWKIQSFDLFPIQRSSNSSEINIEVNGQPVIDNEIQIFNTNNLTITNYNFSLFDMSIVFKCNYTEEISYSESMPYSFEFSASASITQLTLDCANLTNYPSNFTDYYFDGLRTTNYQIIGNNFVILDLIGDVFQNTNSFSLGFYYLDTTDIQRTQLTSNPRTDEDSVIFKEYLTANRTFSYWYFINSYEINSISLNHTRTDDIITSFENESAKYYFEKSCLANDLFEATIDYDPQWDISYSVNINNGTYCRITILYKACLSIHNVTLALDLTEHNLYAENWTYGGATEDSISFVLEIPNLNFTASTQTLIIDGVSSVPYASLASFENEESFTIDEDYDELDEWYNGQVEYPCFSQSFIIEDIESSWDLDGVHYLGDTNDITDVGYFECSGYGTGISSSYLRFETNPIDSVERYQEYEVEGDRHLVKYRIRSNLPSYSVDIEIYIENEGREEYVSLRSVTVESEEVGDEFYKQIKLGRVGDKSYFLITDLDLETGVTEIEIEYKIESVANHWVLFIPLVGGLIFLIYASWRIRFAVKEAKGKKRSRLELLLCIFTMPHRKNPERQKRSLLKKAKKEMEKYSVPSTETPKTRKLPTFPKLKLSTNKQKIKTPKKPKMKMVIPSWDDLKIESKAKREAKTNNKQKKKRSNLFKKPQIKKSILKLKPRLKKREKE